MPARRSAKVLAHLATATFAVVLAAGALTYGVGSLDASATSPCGGGGAFISPNECSYTSLGQNTFAVPVGVTSLHVVADGEVGGASVFEAGSDAGAQTTADIPVTAGNTEYVDVGVDGGAGGSGLYSYLNGGPGGGLSGVYSCSGGSTAASCALVVGGGGGGAGSNGDFDFGGNGGSGASFCNPGATGGADPLPTGLGGGGGGCSSAGGGGAGGDGGGNGAPGATGAPGGANGGSGGSGGSGLDGGGGGGGGYFGGGGGGGGGGASGNSNETGGGGGGGSSFAEPSASNVKTVSDQGTPSLTITWRTTTALAATPAVLGLSPLDPYLFTLTATLTTSPGGAAISGQAISFTAGTTVLCPASTTNSSGTATCTVLTSLSDDLAIILADGYRAHYAGSAVYVPSTSVNPGLIGHF